MPVTERRSAVLPATGSVLGTVAGGLRVPDAVLVPVLAGTLVLSAAKVWRHP